MKYALLLVAGWLCLVPQLASAQLNNLVAMSDVPAVVRNSAAATFPEIDWLIAKQCGDGWYALGGMNAQKKFVEFRTDGQASNSYFRILIQKEEVPAIVRAIWEAHYSTATVTRIQSTGRADGKVIAYRLEASGLPDGKNCFYIGASGDKHFAGND